MYIWFRVTFGERDAVSLLNWLARCNARLLRERPSLPSLYDTSVVYEREEEEQRAAVGLGHGAGLEHFRSRWNLAPVRRWS